MRWKGRGFNPFAPLLHTPPFLCSPPTPCVAVVLQPLWNSDWKKTQREGIFHWPRTATWMKIDKQKPERDADDAPPRSCMNSRAPDLLNWLAHASSSTYSPLSLCRYYSNDSVWLAADMDDATAFTSFFFLLTHLLVNNPISGRRCW